MHPASKMNNMQDIAVTIDHVSKTYKLYKSHTDRVKETFHPFRKKYSHAFNALEDISLHVKRGESIGIIGRNGSGKSTLLQIICGIIKPSLGTVTVNGKISALLELGAGFNPEFTGVQNVYLNASILGLSTEETRSRFDAIAAFADIGDFIHQPVKTYSSGMYVRLAFAIAVHVDPEILIVDEALSVGDIFFQQKCNRYLKENMEQCTKLIVTHDMHAVANLCNRVIVLEHGKIAFEGIPLKAVEYYTRIIHDDLYRPSCKIDTSIVKLPTRNELEKDSSWITVTEDSRGGACEILIEKVKVTSKENAPIMVVQSNDYVLLQMIIQVYLPKEKVIFGYLVKDRVGNAVFGENTCICPTGPVPLKAGRHLVQMGFTWPEIFPGEYTLTPGIGEGDHPHHHIIQCWAHNVVAVSAVTPGRFINGLFNNPITHMEINPI